MPALRCTMCGISWPVAQAYDPCPQCGEKPDPVGNIDPTVTPEEAWSMKMHAEFERFYEEEWKPNVAD